MNRIDQKQLLKDRNFPIYKINLLRNVNFLSILYSIGLIV